MCWRRPSARVPVLLGAGSQALRGRKPDVLGIVVLATMLLSLITALISDGPRELLVRNAWLSLPAGAWTLLSLGVVLLLDCLLRLVMSYNLPVPTVRALDTALTIVTLVALQLPTLYFLWRSGSWQRLFGGRRQARYRPAQDSGTPSFSSANQTAADESDGARQSPRGDNAPPATTFGPFGSADRLN